MPHAVGAQPHGEEAGAATGHRRSGRAKGAACVSRRRASICWCWRNRLLPQLELAEERIEQYAHGRARHVAHRHGVPSVLPVAAQGRFALSRTLAGRRCRREAEAFSSAASARCSAMTSTCSSRPIRCKKPGLRFEPVFDYEQVLVVADSHRLANESYVVPEQLSTEVLITYPGRDRPPRHLHAVPDARERRARSATR